MAYVTQQDMIDRFGEQELIQLTDRTNRPASTIDATTVAAAIGDAEKLADSYLAKRYALPLTPVPDVLVPIVANIARYNLYGERAEKDSAVTRNHKDALTWLKDVAAGTVQLEAAGVASGQSAGGQVQVSAPERIFSRDSLGGY
ncbi:gp436 family protein [Roseibium sp. SCP14]|uniref:gp436 family protein n=1 Tax=Roseibium sp. SCP14 TaxID=3141375 RepID=UPI0033393953